jgi:hypothetical protein
MLDLKEGRHCLEEALGNYLWRGKNKKLDSLRSATLTKL